MDSQKGLSGKARGESYCQHCRFQGGCSLGRSIQPTLPRGFRITPTLRGAELSLQGPPKATPSCNLSTLASLSTPQSLGLVSSTLRPFSLPHHRVWSQVGVLWGFTDCPAKSCFSDLWLQHQASLGPGLCLWLGPLPSLLRNTIFSHVGGQEILSMTLRTGQYWKRGYPWGGSSKMNSISWREKNPWK